MIHVLVEDGGSGYRWCEYIIREVMYKDHTGYIKVESFNGIDNLEKKLKFYDDTLCNDKLIVIYDDIMENPIVSDAMDGVVDFIYEKSNNIVLDGNLFMIPTLGFELMILSLPDIEYLCDYRYYVKFLYEIREMICKGKKSSDITNHTKNDTKYDNFYTKAVEERSKKNFNRYKGLSKEQLYDYCTIESIAKYMISGVFETSRAIDIPTLAKKSTNDTKNCWKDKCCYKKDCKCRSPFVDNNAISLKDKHYLMEYMINNSDYIQLILLIDTLLGITRNKNTVELYEVLDGCVINSLNIFFNTGGFNSNGRNCNIQK